jgi:hypothetical protein
MDRMNWRTSSYSTGNGECVEAGGNEGTVLVRDTKDRQGFTLSVSASVWSEFTSAIK